MLNALVIAFIAFSVYWWAMQGLFSGLLHVAMTILAGVIALALWEPIAGMLLGVLPESAWGIGLLAPFGIALLLLRTASDKFTPGNLNFHNVADKIGGGISGFVSGLLTAGILVVGLQMSGVASLFSHRTFTLDDAGNPKPDKPLIIPVDTIAAGFYTNISDGAFAPAFSDTSFSDFHPSLAVESSMYHQSAFWDAGAASRRGLQDANVKLIEGGFYAVPSVPSKLEDQVNVPPGGVVMIVGTEVLLQVQGRKGAADNDSIFRITRNQVALIYDHNGDTSVAYPVGYTQGGQFESLLADGTYACSAASVQKVEHYWVFVVPEGDAAKPRFLRVKGARLELKAEPVSTADSVAKLVSYVPPPPSEDDGKSGRSGRSRAGASSGRAAPGGADFIEISDRLPWIVNKNQLSGVQLEKDAIVSGTGRIIRKGYERPGQNLQVARVHHVRSAQIVTVNLGTRDAQSLLGQILSFATSATQAPVLVDDQGENFFAMGYTVEAAGYFRFEFDPAQTIRALSRLDLGRVSKDETVKLYYQIPNGRTLVQFNLGRANSQDIDPPLKVE